MSATPITAELRSVLYTRIKQVIKSDLTMERDRLNLDPFSDDQISAFIATNNSKINQVIDHIIRDYKEDIDEGEYDEELVLEQLKRSLDDAKKYASDCRQWVQEYFEIDQETQEFIAYN